MTRHFKNDFSKLLLAISYIVAVVLLPSLHIGGLFHSHEGADSHEVFVPHHAEIQVHADENNGREDDEKDCPICSFISTFAQMSSSPLDGVAPVVMGLERPNVLHERIPCKIKIFSNPPTAPPASTFA